MEAEVIGVNNRSVLRIDASRYADADGFNLLKISSAPCGSVFCQFRHALCGFFRRLTAKKCAGILSDDFECFIIYYTAGDMRSADIKAESVHPFSPRCSA